MQHHGEGLRRLTKDDQLVEKLKDDFRSAPTSDRDRAMLEYAVKLTLEPWSMTEEDVRRLRDAGFEDADILDISQITGYFAFVNRLADGLGVELES
ncbi:MAG: peroxidase-related enzyme [Acidobacteria bacterium]|nr:peroxidase-related enzyme [Acidobacteriota bacterium]